jgi:hypothetical protein
LFSHDQAEKELHYHPTTRHARDFVVEAQPWFRDANFSRQDADAYLAKTPPGAFILRATHSGDTHILDVQAGPRVGHVLLTQILLVETPYHVLPGTSHVFEHLFDLVRFCHYNPFNFRGVNEDNVFITLSLAMSKRAEFINKVGC